MATGNTDLHGVDRIEDVEQLEELLLACKVPPQTLISLQPMSQGEKATRLCAQVALQRGWRLSVQVHKYLGML